MRRIAPLAVLGFLVACGSSPPPAPAPTSAQIPPTPAVTTPPVAETPPAPSPEEKKKADQAAELERDRAKLKADTETEKARWTPELEASAKTLTDKTFPSNKDAIKAAVASPTRKPANAARDRYRHPVETLEFFGLKPNQTVLEYGPGDGWYTEVLAPVVAKKGKLLVTSADPNGPKDERGTFYGEKLQAFLGTAPTIYGKVETVVVDNKAPQITGKDGQVDLVVATRELHGLVNSGKLEPWLAAIRTSLKPGGVLGIEQHRAPAGADPKDSSKKGYLPEKWVIEQIEAAGFKLAGKSEVNANAKDTKDYADGVWALPPTLEGKDKDKDKFVGIGESDRMTLKFVKVADKAAKAADKAPAAKPADKAPAAKPADKK